MGLAYYIGTVPEKLNFFSGEERLFWGGAVTVGGAHPEEKVGSAHPRETVARPGAGEDTCAASLSCKIGWWGKGPGAGGPCPLPHTPSPNPLRGDESRRRRLKPRASHLSDFFTENRKPKTENRKQKTENHNGGWGGGVWGEGPQVRTPVPQIGRASCRERV